MDTNCNEQGKLKKAWAFLCEHRKAVMRYGVIAAAILVPVWIWLYLRPDTWKCYTDEIELSCSSRSVEPQYVMWDDAVSIPGAPSEGAREPAFSPDGTLMAFSRSISGNSDLFVSEWDGMAWQDPEPMRAVNSQFNERTPVFSRNGKFIYFSSDRPGGPGGYDIWVARWDGSEFAWPVPLTSMVNSPYDELSPAPTADGARLFFSSNRPRRGEVKKEEDVEFVIEDRAANKAADFDIFSANTIPAGVTNREVERAISMLYYLRESALNDDSIMKKLGGSQKTEKAIDRALAYLAKRQHADGHWNVPAKGNRHNVAITSLSLLAFFGRGNRHDTPGPYQDTVSRGLKWLQSQQKILGSLEGEGDFYDHAMGTLALGEAYGLTKDEDLFDAAHTAIDFIVETQNEDGGWRYKNGQAPSDLSVSGWMIMALKNADLSGLYVPEETFAGAKRFLEMVAGGKYGGFFGYQNKKSGTGQPAMRVTGYFCSQLLGLSPNTLRSFEAADIMDTRGGTADDFYYMYYGTLAANQHQGPIWKKWRKKLPEQLLPAQNKDGSWLGRGRHSQDMGQVVGTALAALCLQAHYRYTPMYGLGYEPDLERGRLATLTREELPDVPLYRLAKRRYRLSSRSDDIDPVAAKHGDFLYFASDRFGGFGGFDIYRSRISGERPTSPENVGPAVNTRADESGPATRMAGFNLVFTSSKGDKPALYSSVSRRVRIEYDLGNKPSFAWFIKTFYLHLILGSMAAAFLIYWWKVWRLRMKPLEFRAGISKAMRTAVICRRWMLPVLSAAILIGCLLLIRTTLYKTAWCFYTDDEGLMRNALVDTVRPVLWSTHLTYGDLNRPRAEVVPQFSPDGRRVFLSPADATNDSAVFVAEWDGVRWGEGAPAREPVPGIEQAELGGYRFFAEESGWRGTRDLFMGRAADEEDARSLGKLVNSRLDDAVPAARMEGFDLMFASNRGRKDKDQYLLYTSTAREVFTRMNYARWHSFVGVLNRIKWWVLALVAAVWGLWYLMKHMKDMTSLFHKCLLGSAAVHLIILLLMAGWIISNEFIESIESTTMEISVDVNALAQEKLAMDLETDITKMADVADTARVEKSQDAPDMPVLQPDAADDVPDIAAELHEQAFVEKVETVRTEDTGAEQIESKTLDPLEKFEMAMLKVKPVLEEMPADDTAAEEEKPDVPEIEEVALEMTRPEAEKVEAESEQAEAEVPEIARAELEKAAQELRVASDRAEIQKAGAMAAASVEMLKELPAFEIAKVELEVREASKSEDEADFEPEVAGQEIETERRAEERVELAAVESPVDAAQVAVSASSNLMSSAVASEFAPASAKNALSEKGIESVSFEQLLEGFRGAQVKVELEVAPISTSLGAARAEVGDVGVAAMQESLAIERAVGAAKYAETVEDVVKKEEVLGSPETSRAGVPVTIASIESARMPEALASKLGTLPGVLPDALPQAEMPSFKGKLPEASTARTSSTGIESFVPDVEVERITSAKESARLPSGDIVKSALEADQIGAFESGPVSLMHSVARAGVSLARSEVMSAVPVSMRVMKSAQPGYGLGVVRPTVKMELPDVGAMSGGKRFEPLIGQKGLQVARAGSGWGAEPANAPGAAAGRVDLNPKAEAVRGGGTMSGIPGRVSAARTADSGPAMLKVASVGPRLQMKVDVPDRLDIPAGYDRRSIPEIMKDPSKLSDEVITGLGGSGDTQASIATALDWFTRNQARDGRWSLSRHGGNSAHDVGGSSLVLLCYYGWGATHVKEGPHQKAVSKALEWLVSQMGEDGDLRGWRRHRYEEDELLGNMYDHAIATIAICEAYGLTKDEKLRAPCRKAVDFLLASQEKNLGSWRYDPGKDSDTSVLGWAYMALKSAELAGIDVPGETFKRADKWLGSVAGGKFGGIYGYQQPEKKREAMVATGMFCRQLEGVPGSDPKMHEGVGYIATHPLDAEELDYYYMYYATLVMYQNQGPVWEEWNERMKEILLAAQHKTGVKAGTWDPQKWYGFQMGRVVSTAISTLSLEVYYRILPIYGFGSEDTAKTE